jgi:hypothetical protein
MSGRYVSPLPTYTNCSDPPDTYHIFVQADGREQYCLPRTCREHWREEHWSFGQTRG